MPHIRLFRHYVHTPYLLTSGVEAILIVLAGFLGHLTRYQKLPNFDDYLGPAVTYALVVIVSMAAMGVYGSRMREGYFGMMLRTAVAIFLLGTAIMASLSYVFPVVGMDRGVLLFTTFEAYILLALWRWVSGHILSGDALKRRVLVLGTGRRALYIARRMRRQSDRRSFILDGFVPTAEPDLVTAYGAKIVDLKEDLLTYTESQDIEEIVVATETPIEDSSDDGTIKLQQLLSCRLAGIEVCDVQAFIEREAYKIDVDLLRPAWMVYSDGFVKSAWRDFNKRAFDLIASVLLLLFAWPVMLLTGFCIWIAGGFKEPVLYRQQRVGLNGVPFEVLKFRSMHTSTKSDEEPRWAQQNDPRVTRIGTFIRGSRIDELPQLFNVLRGTMSFVGPRPETPTFVTELCKRIPFYDHRHQIKPGITGWAQLCYPYGASEEDAKEKLNFDLYYLKNHSMLLDMIILLQTVEVVLVGEGAR